MSRSQSPTRSQRQRRRRRYDDDDYDVVQKAYRLAGGGLEKRSMDTRSMTRDIEWWRTVAGEHPPWLVDREIERLVERESALYEAEWEARFERVERHALATWRGWFERRLTYDESPWWIPDWFAEIYLRLLRVFGVQLVYKALLDADMRDHPRRRWFTFGAVAKDD